MPKPMRPCRYSATSGDLFTRAEAERFARESVAEFAWEAERRIERAQRTIGSEVGWDAIEVALRELRALAAKLDGTAKVGE